MFKSLFFLICFSLLAACTTTAEPAADIITVTRRPVLTTTATQIVSNTEPAATNTPTPTATPSPTTLPTATIEIQPTPIQETAPTIPPTPTSQSFYPDVWIGGFLMSHTEMQAGNSSISPLIGEGMMIPLQPAHSDAEMHLNSLPIGDVVVLAEGDFYYEGPDAFWLEVKGIDTVNLPYSPQTPLAATYTHSDPVFSFNYPAGWFIEPVENDSDTILRLHNIPPIVREQHFWVGREFIDPTQFDFSLSLKEAASAAAYVAERTADSPCIEDITELNLNGREITRITEACYGTTVVYIFSLNEQIFTISSWAERSAFIERILATFTSD